MATNRENTVGLASLKGFWQQGQTVFLDYGGPLLAVGMLDANTVRVRLAPNGQFRTPRSWSVAKPDGEFPPYPYSINPTAEGLEIRSENLLVKISREGGRLAFNNSRGLLLTEDGPEGGPSWREDGAAFWRRRMPEDEHYYGFGERTGMLDKRGYRYTCWTTDPWQTAPDHGPATDSMYQAIPFFMGLRQETGAYGIYLNNTHRSVFDMGHPRCGYYEIEVEGGELDFYFFYGPEPAQVITAYTGLTGRSLMPPLWALGYHQCRWSYYPEAVVRELARGFRERQIPADVIHLDIDYMEGYRVFTWDKSRFPDPAKLLADLAAQGFKVVTIIDPGVKHQPEGGYAVYEEARNRGYLITNPDGSEYTGFVWPGRSVFPDFARSEVRQWWGELNKGLIELGVAGIWNDMNEPAISQQPFGTPDNLASSPPLQTQVGDPPERMPFAEGRNVYALLMDRATQEGQLRARPDERPFLLTRSGAAGIQRYSTVWTGDNGGYWEHLEMSLPQLCNLGLSGVPFVGVDIGGFAGNGSPELFARWIQLGAFYPFSRGHSMTGVAQKEPWTYGSEVEEITRRALNLRYRLLPYLYTLFYTASQTGAPLWRPLLYHFASDPATYTISDQVLVGHALMLAPVLRPGINARAVYLPEGVWYDFWNDEKLETPGYTLAQAELDTIPLYMRGGNIVPFGPELQYTGQKPIDVITLEVYPDAQGNANGVLYEDDGRSFGYTRGEFCLTRFNCLVQDGKARVSAQRQGNFAPAPRTLEVWVHGLGETRHHTFPHDPGNWQIEI